MRCNELHRAMKYFHEKLDHRRQQLCKNIENSKSGTYARRRYPFRDEYIRHYSSTAHDSEKIADPPSMQQWRKISSNAHGVLQAAAKEMLELTLLEISSASAPITAFIMTARCSQYQERWQTEKSLIVQRTSFFVAVYQYFWGL